MDTRVYGAVHNDRISEARHAQRLRLMASACDELRRQGKGDVRGEFNDFKQHLQANSDTAWRMAFERAYDDRLLGADFGHETSRYVTNLHSAIKSHRYRRKWVSQRSVVEDNAEACASAVRTTLGIIEKRGHRSPEIRVGGVPEVVRHGSQRNHQCDIRLPTMWMRNVLGRGIAVAEMQQHRCLVVSATKVQSTFLNSEGIDVYDALIYIPAAKPQAANVSLFCSHITGQDNIVVAHKDFSLGVSLIRRRIRSLVFDGLQHGNQFD